MRDELKIKDKLVSNLLTGEDPNADQNLNAYQTAQPPSHSPDSAALRKQDLTNKLRDELDDAYKALSKRDIELRTLRKNTKALAYNQCNQERISYMNECLKLQKLLKQYGSSSPNKMFRGIQVT